MRSFLLDPNRGDFIASHIQTQHDELLSVATFIASLLRTGSLSNDLKLGASSLMSINLWLSEVAQECKHATASEIGNGTLPPLVCDYAVFYFYPVHFVVFVWRTVPLRPPRTFRSRQE